MLEEEQKSGEGLRINGSVMLALAESKEEVLKALQEDVYYKRNIWDRNKIQIHPVCRTGTQHPHTQLTTPKFKSAFREPL